jgi:hypothetical protein
MVDMTGESHMSMTGAFSLGMAITIKKHRLMMNSE